MNGPALLADHLDAQTDAIVAVWRSSVEKLGKVPGSERLSDGEFADHIPELLDRLADRLRGRHADPSAEAKKHGRVRWYQGYDITEVIRELGQLRLVLMGATLAYARKHALGSDTVESSWRVVCEVMNEATAESVAHFQALSTTETQAARAEAERTGARLHTILDNLPAGVWVTDSDGRIIEVNREGERIQGRPAADVIGRLDAQRLGAAGPFVSPTGEPYGPGELPVSRALRGEPAVQEELVWPGNGQPRTLVVNATPLTDAGEITGAVVVAQDVTHTRQAERRLLHHLAFTRAITDSMGEGLITADPEGRITSINPAGERMLGWAAAELAGRPLHETILARRPDGSTRPPEEDPLLRAIGRGQILRGDEAFCRLDGSTLPVGFAATPIGGDASAGAVITFHDIAGRKQLEASLAASEARFRSIAEQSPVMIWRSGPLGEYDYVNRTYLSFRGRGLAQVTGAGWLDGVHPDDAETYRATFLHALGHREPFEHTFRMLRHDGQYRWLTSRGTPYYGNQGEFLGYLGSCLDITERIELQKAIDQQRELAEKASAHKSRLLSALSHDARTPLNAVVLSAQLLELHCRDSGDPEVETCLRTIRHSVGNVLDLLGDLLNLTKIDAGALPVEASRFGLEAVLAESLSSVDTQARLKGLDVRLEPGPLAGIAVETDRAKLKQILCNLLSNALRYTERGHICVRGERTDDQVRIAVEDTGIGIAPADQTRVFDEFATLGNGHDQRSTEGTGLGLAICRRLANLLKGEILLESTPGLGSIFTLVLPASIVTEAPAAPPSSARVSPAGSGLVLIAEDHLTSRQTLAKVLRRMGYRVAEAGNGRDVLALVRQERPLAVLMDVNMPVMDGIEATLALRAEPEFRDLPIFALTGDVSVINQRRIGEAGVNGYLEKPITWEALKEALASLRPA